MANYRAPINLPRAKRRYEAGWTLKRIAQEERCSISAVWRRLTEAKVTLRHHAGINKLMIRTVAQRLKARSAGKA